MLFYLALGPGFQPLGAAIDPNIVTSVPIANNPTDLDGPGSIHLELIPDDPSMPQFIDFDLANPVVVSGFRVTTSRENYVRAFNFFYVREYVHFPDNLIEIDLMNDIKVEVSNTAVEPQLIFKQIHTLI